MGNIFFLNSFLYRAYEAFYQVYQLRCTTDQLPRSGELRDTNFVKCGAFILINYKYVIILRKTYK